MNEIFGVSMSSIMIVLLVLLGVCLLAVGWMALRRPVIFKMGMRNIPRRPAQTALIIVGLMLSTLIMAAAMGVGDTFDRSLSNTVVDLLGPVDEIVVADGDGEASAMAALNASLTNADYTTVTGIVDDDPNVDGVYPFLVDQVPAQITAKGQSEPSVRLAGIDPSLVPADGGLTDLDGNAIDVAELMSSQPNGVILAEQTAEELDAAVGDVLTTAYNNQPFEFPVSAIAENSIFLGQMNAAELGMAIPLDSMRTMTGKADALNFVGISNAGGDRDGVKLTDEVTATLEAGLTGAPLGVSKVKQDGLDDSATAASLFTGFFLVLGLFSIAAGILLIILIFTMLAAERRPEMGMARAVGARRGQLFQQFVSEGTGYALPAGLVGALLGVGATYVIASVMRSLFGDFFPIDAMVTPRSLVVAFCLGIVITFLAITGASWRSSRLNVVAAVRDIPDVSNPKRKWRTLVWAALLVVGGLGLIVLGRDTEQLIWFSSGVSLVPFGVALALRYFGVPGRPIFTLVGLFILLFFLMPDNLFTRLFGTYSANFEMFFVSGIFMVTAATIVIVNNLTLLLSALSTPRGSLIGGAIALVAAFAVWRINPEGLGKDALQMVEEVLVLAGTVLLLMGLVGVLLGLFSGSTLPAVRTAIAYPGSARGRTGMTIAMFSLIVFSLVMIATMSTNFSSLFLGDEANAGWDVRADASSANPISDFTGELDAKGVDTEQFAAVGVVTTPDLNAQLRVAGGEFERYFVNGMDEDWLNHAELTFSGRAEGFADDAAILEALKTRTDVAVLDASAVPGQGDPEAFSLEGVELEDGVFAPMTVEIERPGGEPVPVTIIGLIDQTVSSLYGLYASRATIDPIYPRMAETSYFIAAKDADRADAIAKEVEAALLPNGVQAVSIRDELEEGQGIFQGVLYLIQGFMGLGLIVGIAAIGVIAYRSVVERRQHIGMLRALGFQRSMVSLSFLIETAFVVLLGLISGTFLGIALAQSLLNSPDFGTGSAGFLVPWPLILVILAATMVIALLMAWLPSRQAAGIAPAEALRYE